MARKGRGTWNRQGRALEDNLVLTCLALAVFSTVWFTLFAIHPFGPPALLWATTPVYGPLVAAIFWRISGAPGLLADNQRFWRRLTPAPILVGIAQSIQAVEALRHPQAGELRNAPAMLIFDGLALLVIIYALVRLPSGLPAARVRVLLDTSTVVLATAVFIWHFGTRQALQQVVLDGRGIGTVFLSLALVVMTLVGVYALARMVISQYQVLDGAGVRFLATGMFFGALAPMAEPLVQSLHQGLHVLQVSMPLVFLTAAKAAAVQRDTAARPNAHRQAQARSFSLLPYSAVVAVDGLLLWVVFTDHADLGVVATAAVLLTAIVLVRQISSLLDNSRLLAQLDHAATHDALTGLPNRVLFQRRLAQALSPPAGAVVSPVAVLLIDLDDFKEVNDTLGHEVGDLLLIAVTGRLQACIGGQDTIARLGGDEFVIVLHNADAEASEQTAALLVQSLHHPVHAGAHELPVRASIGIANAIAGEDASALLRRADIAMYAAKKSDGNGFQRHHGGMASTGSDHTDLVAELREAIEDDQLFLLYQPIVSLRDGQLLGAEALVRWAHPTRGVLTPDLFLPAAERSGLTVDLARWVLRSAFGQLSNWPSGPAGGEPPRLHINLSARDLREPGLSAEVGELLKSHSLAPQRITIEITESSALESPQAITTLHELRALGLRISLDDFGTGHSTLSLLHDCPVDEVKLDRAFTRTVAVQGSVPVAAAVAHLVKALGIHTVAEGVETPEQARELLALGYVAAQGYLFARPLPAGQFIHLQNEQLPVA